MSWIFGYTIQALTDTLGIWIYGYIIQALTDNLWTFGYIVSALLNFVCGYLDISSPACLPEVSLQH